MSTKVYQTITDFEHVNCVQACVASIFELKLTDVPNFMENGEWEFLESLYRFCAKMGLYPMDVEIIDNAKGENLLRGTYSIGTGLSPRGNLKNQHHAVVCYEGVIQHDPAGNMIGLYNNKILFHTVFIVKDPSKFKSKFKGE